MDAAFLAAIREKPDKDRPRLEDKGRPERAALDLHRTALSAAEASALAAHLRASAAGSLPPR